MSSSPTLTVRERRALRAAVTAAMDRLDDQITALTRSFDDIVDANVHANTDDEHDPEGTTIAFERSQISSLLQSAKEERVALRATLDRVEAGDEFGLCEHCNRFIGVDRLMALPAATRCIACAR